MDNCDIDEEIIILAAEILHYLQSHPNATDTVEGVAKWWIWQQRISTIVEQVQLALDYLVRSECVVCRRVAGGHTVYSLTDDDRSKKAAWRKQ